jgi:hypothetical protein
MNEQIQKKIMQHKVLVVDRDTNTTFILKSELERSGKVQVKVATSTRDIELSLDATVPDIMTMHFGVTQRAQDEPPGRPSAATRRGRRSWSSTTRRRSR